MLYSNWRVGRLKGNIEVIILGNNYYVLDRFLGLGIRGEVLKSVFRFLRMGYCLVVGFICEVGF